MMQQTVKTTLVCVDYPHLASMGFKSLKEWMDVPNNLYIGDEKVMVIDGKRFPEGPQYFTNPHKVSQSLSPTEARAKYEMDIRKMIESGSVSLEQFASLHGKTLGCNCNHEACHGTAVKFYIDWAHDECERNKQRAQPLQPAPVQPPQHPQPTGVQPAPVQPPQHPQTLQHPQAQSAFVASLYEEYDEKDDSEDEDYEVGDEDDEDDEDDDTY